MMRHVSRIAVLCIWLIAVASQSPADERPPSEWLRGSGDDLELRLSGRVFEADGRPATGLQVSGGVGAGTVKQSFEPTVDGDQFELWIPVNRIDLYSMWLKASTRENDHVAYHTFNSHELRQAAIDGLTLTLAPPTRQVQVKVVHDGRPVADATVVADLAFFKLESKSNADGIAQFGLLQKQELQGVSAWTSDFRVGGYSFDRAPQHDPALNEYTIELSACRDQKLRFVEPDGTPVPGLDFVIQMATPAPNYNFLGNADHVPLTTDAAGEAMYRWFPEWDNHHFYADLRSREWVTGGEHRQEDDAVIFPVKRRVDRKRVTGRVAKDGAAGGGFWVFALSFQGEQERHSDHQFAFTAADGSFSIDVLPNATYCAYVLDSRWVGAVVDLIPYESAADRVTSPELTVMEGQDVELQATIGGDRRPYANLGMYVRRPHEFTWQENGETRHGSGGPSWGITTDDSGRATVRTLPGALKVSVYTPFWRAEEKIKVEAGQPATVRLHRAIDAPRTVSGRVQFAEGAVGDLQDVEIKAGSVDGATTDESSPTAGADGAFAFETRGTAAAVFARTRDGRFAGAAVSTDLDSSIDVTLHPTIDFHGRLLGEDDRPIVDHTVLAVASVSALGNVCTPGQSSIEVLRREVKTDGEGNYALPGLPCGAKVTIWTMSPNDPDSERYIDEIQLDPGESRPVAVNRLGRRAADMLPLPDRYQTTLRDCALCGYRLMLILPSAGEEVDAFVGQHLLNNDTNPGVYSFMQLTLTPAQLQSEPDAASFLAAHDWRPPAAGHVLACAVDAQGNELARIDVDVADPSAAEAAAELVRRHAPETDDAEQNWNTVFAEAERTNRHVWVRISQRYCGPCFLFARWLDDQKSLLERDYLMLKIDDYHDIHGEQVAERLTRGAAHGVPFHAIFDPKGELLVDSAGQLGNVGHPSGFEGRKQLRKMLLETRRSLTDAEIDQLVESVDD